MSYMSELDVELREAFAKGLSASVAADLAGVPVEMVQAFFEVLADEQDAEYDESMDGDFDSAMASAGYGTDEDYGYFGGDEQ
jgi:steroid 5-alpha reductase family enzyme